MHRQYQQVCKAQQEASARNKLLLEDVKRLQRQLVTPARSKLEQLKSRYEEEIIKQYPVWLEQVQQYKRQKDNLPLTGASQQPDSSHAPFVAPTADSPVSHVTIATVTTNSNNVSSDSLTTANGYSPSPLADFNHSNQTQENIASHGHTPQQSNISLASLSSGSLDHQHDDDIVPYSTISTDHISGKHLSGSHDPLTSHDLSISHDVVSSEDDDFWNSEAPPITTAATPAVPLSNISSPNDISAYDAAQLSTAAGAPPTTTIVTTAPPSTTVVTKAPPTATVVTATPPICSSTEIPPISTSTVATPTVPTTTNIISLFVVTTTATPITSAVTPTSSSTISITPISNIVISAASPMSSSTVATPILSAMNSSGSATPITDNVTPTTTNVVQVSASTESSSGSVTPISGSATPPKMSLLSRPTASDSANQNAAHQTSVAVLETSTSAGFEEHVPLTETAAYQSLARSIHHHDDSSSEISEGSAVLELEQLNSLSPELTCSYRQEGLSTHGDATTQAVKVTQQLVTMDTDDDSSLSLPPSEGGGGYVPSASDSRKRTTYTSHVIDLKKLGILGGSEEELNELPAAPPSETTQSNQLDEFDFYN